MARAVVTYSEYDNYVVCEGCDHVEYAKSAWASKAAELGHCPTCAVPIKHHKKVLGRWKNTCTKRFIRMNKETRVFEIHSMADSIADKLEKRDM